MRKLNFLIVLVAVSAIVFSGCKKDKTKTKTPLGQETFVFDFTDSAAFPAIAIAIFDALPAGQYAPIFSDSFATNTEATLASEGHSKSQIESIKGKTLRVNILNNPTQMLDFMDTIKVYVREIGTTEDVLFGYAYDYPLGLRTLNLTMVDVEAKDAFKGEKVIMSLGGTKRAGSHPIQADTKLNFVAEVNYVVNLLK